MRSRALLLAGMLLTAGALVPRAMANRRTPVEPLRCDAVVGLVTADGGRTACLSELSSCLDTRSGRRYEACRDRGPLRGAVLRLFGQPIDVRDASVEDLTALPGIGPGLAGRIVSARAVRPICGMDDLRRVPGIGPKRLSAIVGHVAFGDPLCGLAGGR